MAFTIHDQAAQGQLTSALSLLRREAAVQLERKRTGEVQVVAQAKQPNHALPEATQAGTIQTTLVPPPAAHTLPHSLQRREG